MSRVLVVAVHPDDETLGCGGTLLRHRARKDEVHWLVVTAMSAGLGFSERQMAARAGTIREVERAYGFAALHDLGLESTRLDALPRRELVGAFSEVFQRVKPHIVYLPFCHDVHSDHRVAFEAAFSCVKSFRRPEVERVLMMETLSETEFAPAIAGNFFVPNVFMDISGHLARKMEIMRLYESEISSPPFPRSLASIEALARYRGVAGGFLAAEAFMLLLERNP